MATIDGSAVRRYRQGSHVYVAELRRPRVKNAFDDAMYQQLMAALDEFEAADELHALVITGHGDYFTSGADIEQAMGRLGDGESQLPSKGEPKKFMHRLLDCKKLVVAAVNGPAIGIGVTLLMHCDLVFAADRATFWTPFMRLGIVPEYGSSYMFPHVLGRLAANDLLMRSKQIDANRALAIGLVGDVLPSDGFLDRVFAEIEPLVNDPHTARNLPAYKKINRRVQDPLVREAIVAEYEELDRRFLAGETQRAAVALFQQLRPKNKSSRL